MRHLLSSTALSRFELPPETGNPVTDFGGNGAHDMSALTYVRVVRWTLDHYMAEDGVRNRKERRAWLRENWM